MKMQPMSDVDFYYLNYLSNKYCKSDLDNYFSKTDKTNSYNNNLQENSYSYDVTNPLNNQDN